MSRKRIKPIIETIPGYTEKQSQYLRGEISDSDVDGKFFRWLLKRAVNANDTEVIERAEKRLAELKEESAERNRQNSRESMHRLYRGESPVLKPTKRTEYTERHKQIIRNEIDPKTVHGTELTSILKIARVRNDYQIESLIESIITERRENQREALNKRLCKMKNDSRLLKYKKNDKSLTLEELSLLNCELDSDLFTVEDIEHIIDVCKTTNDTENLKLAELTLQYKQNPRLAYVTQDVDEALSIIEKAVGIPITRRKDLLTE